MEISFPFLPHSATFPFKTIVGPIVFLETKLDTNLVTFDFAFVMVLAWSWSCPHLRHRCRDSPRLVVVVSSLYIRFRCRDASLGRGRVLIFAIAVVIVLAWSWSCRRCLGGRRSFAVIVSSWSPSLPSYRATAFYVRTDRGIVVAFAIATSPSRHRHRHTPSTPSTPSTPQPGSTAVDFVR